MTGLIRAFIEDARAVTIAEAAQHRLAIHRVDRRPRLSIKIHSALRHLTSPSSCKSPIRLNNAFAAGAIGTLGLCCASEVAS